MKIILSIAQFRINFGNPAANLEKVALLATQCKKQDSQLLLLPELWTSGYDLKNAIYHQKNDRKIVKEIVQIAEDNNIAIAGSYLWGTNEKKITNTLNVISSNGEVVGRYSKIHLFRLMDEEKWLHQGGHLQAIDFCGCLTGLAICYDLRFPEIFRSYALNGVKLVLISAEWPLKRINHWATLLKARAIENQMFVAACNTVGDIGDETFGGRSAIINPWGEVLAEGSENTEDLLTVEIDLDEVDQIRQKIPVLADRRPEVYGRWSKTDRSSSHNTDQP